MHNQIQITPKIVSVHTTDLECRRVVGLRKHLSMILHHSLIQGDHLSGKPGNVREFDSCQGNLRDFTENHGIVSGKNLVREKLPKTVYCKLHAYLCPYRYLVGVCCVLNVKYMVLDHVLLQCIPTPPLTVTLVRA